MVYSLAFEIGCQSNFGGVLVVRLHAVEFAGMLNHELWDLAAHKAMGPVYPANNILNKLIA